MTLSEKHAAAIAKSSDAFRERIVESMAIENEVRAYSARSRKVANAYRQKLLDKVFAQSGVDQDELRKLQAASVASDQKFLRSLKSRVDDRSKEINKSQKLRADAFFRKHRPHHNIPPGPPAPPTYSGEILLTADSIEAYNINPGIPYTTSVGPEKNIARVWLQKTSNSSPIFVFSFLWVAPIAGSFDAIALVDGNGSSSWQPEWGCLHTDGAQTALVVLGLGTLENPAGGGGVVQDYLYHRVWDFYPGCLDGIGLDIIDNGVSPESSMQVMAGDAVLVQVAINVNFHGDNLFGDLDFYNAGKELNVAGVVVSVTANPPPIPIS